MSAGKKFYGSICLTDLLEHAKKGHPAFTRSEKNGKIYCKINEWVNDEPNQHGYHASLQLVKSKEQVAAKEKSIYIGNLKLSEQQGGEQVLQPGEVGENLDDLPF